MAEEPEGAAVVRRLLRTAYGPAPEPAGPARPGLRDLAQKAVHEPKHADRFDASMALCAGYGERAVPELLEYSGAADADTRIHAYLSILRLGTHAVLPLAAAARSEDPDVRRFAVGALGAIRDPRALPVVLEIEEADEPREKRSPTARAARKLRDSASGWIGSASAAEAYRDLARRCYEGDPAAVSFPSSPATMWSLEAGKLVPRAVDRHLYFIELGMAAAKDALRLDPSSQQAILWLERLRESEALAMRLSREFLR